MPTTPSKASGDAADATSIQPPRSDAPAGADPDTEDKAAPEEQPQGSPAAPAMKQFAKTEAESGVERK